MYHAVVTRTADTTNGAPTLASGQDGGAVVRGVRLMAPGRRARVPISFPIDTEIEGTVRWVRGSGDDVKADALEFSLHPLGLMNSFEIMEAPLST